VTDDGLVFLVMDLLQGESVEKRLSRGGKLPPPEVLTIAGALLDVLAAAHAKGIIHRDVKPENVFLCKDGTVRLLDFGIARLREETSKSQTLAGAAMGTPSFMPPEQARGRWEMVDGRSDLWSVGATMFALLTGRPVHDAETVNETLLLAMSHPAAPLAKVWPEAPPAIAAIVDRALAYEMRDRWPDAAAMRQAVRDAAEGRAVAPPPGAQAPLVLPTNATVAAVPPPAGGGGTMLAASRSNPPPPAGLFATRSARIALGAGAGGLVLGVAIVAIALSRGKASGPGEPHVAAQVGAQTTSEPFVQPAAVASDPAAAAALPSAVLAEIPAAPSASVEEVDVSQLPTAATRPPAMTTAPAGLPAVRPATSAGHPGGGSVLAPWPGAAPTAVRPATTPGSNPLDRRH
jgi:serine/threonine-protein kinase